MRCNDASTSFLHLCAASGGPINAVVLCALCFAVLASGGVGSMNAGIIDSRTIFVSG